MKRKYWIWAIGIFVLAGYFGLMFLLSNTKEKTKEEAYLFIWPRTLLTVEDEKFHVLDNQETHTLNMYAGSRSLGKVTIVPSTNFYAMYDGDQVHYAEEDPVLGYSDNFNIEVKNFTFLDYKDSDIELIKEVARSIGVNYISLLSSLDKITYDFDRDGVDETMYAASNAFVEETYDKEFSLVFYIDSGKTEILFQEVGEAGSYEIGLPFLQSVVDYKKDGKFDVIYGISYYDQMGTLYQMVEFDGNERKIIFDIKN